METENPSKYLVPFYQSTRRYVADAGDLCQQGSEDLECREHDPSVP